jgi:hypothetical protein
MVIRGGGDAGRDSEDELTRALTARVLQGVAPEELPFLDDVLNEFGRDPDAVLRKKSREEALGFGLELQLVAPYVVAAAGAAVHFLLSTLVDVLKDESRARIIEVVHGWISGKRGSVADSGADVVALSSEQARRVRNVALVKATDLGLPEDRAALLADAIIGAVVMAN